MDGQQPTAVLERLLPAFTYDLDSWFTHIEAIWTGATLTDLQKFTFVARAIPTDVAALVTGVLRNPPEDNKYKALKDELLQAFGRTKLSYLQQLESVQLDGRRPSALMARMQALNNASPTPPPTLDAI